MQPDQEHVNPFASPMANEAAVPSDPQLANLESIRREHLSREASIKSVGFLYLLGAVLSLLVLIGLTFAFITALSQGENSAETGVMLAVMALYAGLAGLSWWIGRGLRNLNPAVRIWTIVLSAIGLLGFPVGTLINGYIIWLVASRKGAYVLSAEYREIVAATPHIKYKTSIAVWILLALVVALLIFAVVAVATS